MIFAPMMPDDLAVRCRLTPVAAITDHWRRDALALLAELNELRASDIYIQCGFVGDQIAIGSMRRWQPDMKITSVARFIQEASEAIEYLRAEKRRKAG